VARTRTSTSTPDFEGAPPDLDAAELDEAARSLAAGDAVRVALPRGRIALCSSLEEVKLAQRGKIAPDAKRLDRGPSR
jgi:hypothetical protein